MKGEVDDWLAKLQSTGARRLEMREATDPPPTVYIAVIEFTHHFECAAAHTPQHAIWRLAKELGVVDE